MASRPDRVQYENSPLVADTLRMVLTDRDPMSMHRRVNEGKLNGTLKEFISFECQFVENPWVSTPLPMLYGAYKTRHRLAAPDQRLSMRMFLKRLAELDFPDGVAYGERIVIGLKWNGDHTDLADRMCRTPDAEYSDHASLVSGVCDVCERRVKLTRSHRPTHHLKSPLRGSPRCFNRTDVREGTIRDLPECVPRGWELE